MTTVNDIIQEIKQLQEAIADKKKALRPLFEAGVAELCKKHAAKSLEIGINNHEFNDGEATHFSLYYDDITVRFDDGVVAEAYSDDDDELTAQHKTARKELVKFFGAFDVDRFYEDVYGDAYESITIRHKNGKIQTED